MLPTPPACQYWIGTKSTCRGHWRSRDFFLTLGLALIGVLRGTMSTKVALFQIWQICPPTPWLWTRGRCCSSRSCSGLSTCSAERDRLGSHTWFINFSQTIKLQSSSYISLWNCTFIWLVGWDRPTLLESLEPSRCSAGCPSSAPKHHNCHEPTVFDGSQLLIFNTSKEN